MNSQLLTLSVKSIRCLMLHESIQDELYCVLQKYDQSGNKLEHYRMPIAGYWPIQADEIIFPEAELATLSSTSLPHILRLHFKEEDIPDLSRTFIEALRSISPDFLPEIADDFLGDLYLIWLPDLSIKWIHGMNVYEFRPTEIFDHVVDLLIPGQFHYQLHFHLNLISF